MFFFLLIAIPCIVFALILLSEKTALRFVDEKGIAQILKLDMLDLQDAKRRCYSKDEYIYHLSERKNSIKKHYSNSQSVILSLTALIVILTILIAKIYIEHDSYFDTGTEYYSFLWRNVNIHDSDSGLCELCLFLLGVGSLSTYFGFLSYGLSSLLALDDDREHLEKEGYAFGMALMLVGLMISFVLICAMTFNLYGFIDIPFEVELYFKTYIICNAIVKLVFAVASFFAHRCAQKRRYMNSVWEQIKNFYDSELENTKLKSIIGIGLR